MSMYNMMFGTNSRSGVLLACLGISENDVPRFRDCFLDGDKIVIHTRTGGGNRDYYESEEECRSNYPDYFDGEDDPSGPWNDDLRSMPTYLYDEDDDYDCTYANFYFSIPKEFEEDIAMIAEGSATLKPSEKWQLLLETLKG